MLIPQPALTLVTAVVLAASGCNQPSPTSAAPPGASTVNPVQQSVTPLLTAGTSGFTEGEELVIRSDTALSAAWKTVHAGIPGNPAPTIDLAHNMVVLLALGQRRTGGYSIRFDSINREGTGAVVHYTVTSPGPGCMTPQMITSPVDVVSVPTVAGAVRFDRTDVTDRC